MNTNLLTLDIETGPLPEKDLVAVMPEFEAPSNYKDPQKIAEAIAKQRQKWIADAALSALTGQVLAVGLHTKNHGVEIFEGSGERDLIEAVFAAIRNCAQGSQFHLCGFNLHLFDLPFVFRRGWAHQMAPPITLASGRFWPAWVIDLRTVWQLGDRSAAGSLDSIGRALGLGGAEGKGAEFAQQYADPATRPQALAHLRRDLELTAAIAERLVD